MFQIVVKAASSILLLLLKHFRLNHVYQFEYLGQHLVFANCIPLILKFFDQKIAQYIQSKNDLNPWNFPQVVLQYAKSGTFLFDLIALNIGIAIIITRIGQNDQRVYSSCD